MFIPDPDFYPSLILDPGSKYSNKERGKKLFLLSYLFCSHKYHKIANHFIFYAEEKNLVHFPKFFTQKIVINSQKYGFGIRDPGSGKNLFRIQEPGVKKATDPGSGSATLVIILLSVFTCVLVS
jgi:hypothetical protein